MRTTIELPDDLLGRAKSVAASSGISLKELFIQAIEQRLTPQRRKVRRPPPVVGSPDAPRIGVLTPEETDEARVG